tara:strand:- start:10214 stop:10780 length:567 start_codon:yes stop_codon:yes gene_type:complete
MRLKMEGTHLDKGKTNNSKSCPIALLLKDSLKDSEKEALLLGDGNEYTGWLDVRVHFTQVERINTNDAYEDDTRRVDYGHSEGVREFIRNFDALSPSDRNRLKRNPVDEPIEIVPMISTSKRRRDKEGKETQFINSTTRNQVAFIEDFDGEEDIKHTSVLLPAPHPCRQLVLESEVEDYEERGYKKMI